MQTNLKEEPKALQKALEQKQQAEARLAAERTKYAADLYACGVTAVWADKSVLEDMVVNA